MSVVEYIDGKSIFHKLDPRFKLIMLLAITLVIFTVRNAWVICGMFVMVFICWKIAGIPIRKLTGMLKILLGLVSFIFLAQALFQIAVPGIVNPFRPILNGEPNLYFLNPLIPNTIPVIGGIGKISVNGVRMGFLVSIRLLTLICLMPLVTMTTEINVLALGLVKMGLPYKAAYMATTALNMVPTLQAEIGTIMDAQKLRAFTVFEEGNIPQKLKAYPTLVVPLVIGAMKKAQLMGVAMDARAFGCRKNRTYIDKLNYGTKDNIAFVILAVIVVGLISLNFIL
ncbi:MAG: energy-coupling factor transporter transmembrane component T [Clostridia bacterium]